MRVNYKTKKNDFIINTEKTNFKTLLPSMYTAYGRDTIWMNKKTLYKWRKLEFKVP